MAKEPQTLGRPPVNPVRLDDSTVVVAVPVVGAGPELRHQWELAVQSPADLIEWRIDELSAADLKLGAELRKAMRVPVLVTARTTAEGGKFSHGDNRGDQERYRDLLGQAASWADAVDVEYCRSGSAELVCEIEGAGSVPVLSFHEFDRPFNVAQAREHLRRMDQMGPGVAKIAWAVRTADELAQILELQKWAVETLTVPSVVIGMGAEGSPTRIGAGARRSAFTFATAGQVTAPGQFTVEAVRQAELN